MFLLVCREGTFQALNAMPALISIILLPLSNEKELKKITPFCWKFCRLCVHHLLFTKVTTLTYFTHWTFKKQSPVASLVMMPISFNHIGKKHVKIFLKRLEIITEKWKPFNSPSISHYHDTKLSMLMCLSKWKSRYQHGIITTIKIITCSEVISSQTL